MVAWVTPPIISSPNMNSGWSWCCNKQTPCNMHTSVCTPANIAEKYRMANISRLMSRMLQMHLILAQLCCVQQPSISGIFDLMWHWEFFHQTPRLGGFWLFTAKINKTSLGLSSFAWCDSLTHTNGRGVHHQWCYMKAGLVWQSYWQSQNGNTKTNHMLSLVIYSQIWTHLATIG